MKQILTIISVVLLATNLNAFDSQHKAFDAILKKYVKNGRVNYKGIQTERSKLNVYLVSLSAVSQSEYNKLSKNDKMAFLINAYNAFTITLILDNYPVKSIKKIGGLFGSPWKIEFFSLLGSKRNLDWIEHKKLRVDFNEPRIHFAIVCASIGCPILASEAYVGSKLDSQLEIGKTKFLNDSKRNWYDATKKKLYLSSIFKWFKEDFTKQGSLIDFVQSGMKDVKISKDASIKYNSYDWNLNEK